jgi:hypothetical protein
MSRDESRRPDSGTSDEPADADDAPRWDADDERRRHDQMAPPQDPCECWCMHCRRVFMSDRMWFQRVINDPQGFPGFWMCPTPNCSGAGFTFDIFPTDPDHPANADWYSDDGDEDEELPWDDDFEGAWDGPTADNAGEEWDPDEPAYRALDEAFGDEPDHDLEGEEWKYGLQPGERPSGFDGRDQDWITGDGTDGEDDEERKYDEPDERPRVLDWGNRPDRQVPPGSVDGYDDIPF